MKKITKAQITKFARTFGQRLDVVKHANTLFNCFVDPNTPQYTKLVIVGALFYLVTPIDAIPDFTPIVGLVDDLAVIATCINEVAKHILPEHSKQEVSDGENTES